MKFAVTFYGDERCTLKLTAETDAEKRMLVIICERKQWTAPTAWDYRPSGVDEITLFAPKEQP